MHDLLMNPPYSADVGGAVWALIRPNRKIVAEVRHCEWCGKKLRATAGCYRTKRWGPNADLVVWAHQKCLLGQIDPTVWDIPIGGQ